MLNVGNEFTQKIYTTGHLSNIDRNIPRCLKCYPKYIGISNKEKELFDFCKLYFPNISKNKKIIKPLELDIVIEELKLAIEFNGNYYHSIVRTPNNYHLNKTIQCNKKGYRLIHIWEDEWDNNKEEIKQKLINIFTYNEKLQFNQTELILDYSWYNNLIIPNYIFICNIPPKCINRNNYIVENCGYIVYKKEN